MLKKCCSFASCFKKQSNLNDTDYEALIDESDHEQDLQVLRSKLSIHENTILDQRSKITRLEYELNYLQTRAKICRAVLNCPHINCDYAVEINEAKKDAQRHIIKCDVLTKSHEDIKKQYKELNHSYNIMLREKNRIIKELEDDNYFYKKSYQDSIGEA